MLLPIAFSRNLFHFQKPNRWLRESFERVESLCSLWPPVISRDLFMKTSTSEESLWQTGTFCRYSRETGFRNDISVLGITQMTRCANFCSSKEYQLSVLPVSLRSYIRLFRLDSERSHWSNSRSPGSESAPKRERLHRIQSEPGSTLPRDY